MKNIFYKPAFVLVIVILSAIYRNADAQVGKWRNFPAYQNATLVAETPNLVFAVYDGALLSYSPDDQEVRTWSMLNGLSGNSIAFMIYDPTSKALILVYSDSNIDVFFGDGNVYNFPEIKNDNMLRDKTINNVEVIGNYVYLSTAFGIVVIDVDKRIIINTYRLGCSVNSVCKFGDYLYAATEEGIKKAALSSNLLDKENWAIWDDTSSTMDLTRVHKLLIFNNTIVLIKDYEAFYLEPDRSLNYFRGGTIKNAKILNNQLVINGSGIIDFYSDLDNHTTINIEANSIDSRNGNNAYWLAMGSEGLTGIKKLPDASDYETTVSGIKVNSPAGNTDFSMTVSGDKLYIAGGGRGADRYNIPGTLMIFDGNRWTNLNSTEIAAQTGLICDDFMSVAVDPTNPDKYYVASWGEGLYVFENDKFTKLYSYGNSSLQTAIPGNPDYVRIDGLTFDKNNNLYMVNGGVLNGLSIFFANGEWKNFYYPAISSCDPNKIIIAKDNKKWFNIWRSSKAGIMVLDDNGTPDDISDDVVASSTRFVDQNGYDISATGYLDMAEDANGVIWVGTDNGPIRFYSAQQVEEGLCNRPVSTDDYGSAFRLLEGIKVNAIAIDAANRKWLGTENAGLFLVDDQSDPQKMQVENFTVENSYLLSNKITALAINHKTGEVFIGTDKGLCSYRTEATLGSDDYSQARAFPNPVRPSSDSQVVISGLMDNSLVKITDMGGNLIKEGKSAGGQFIWNCATNSGQIVKAGIYLVFASTPEGKQGVVTKVMVIK
ncbi:MAG: hypothetical protein LBR64_01910 [Dysgonamonadaceae bacterium]|jgi:hypothetical protein|nr:hypothetical protein [Dysgonamonadaceae bacterium]